MILMLELRWELGLAMFDGVCGCDMLCYRGWAPSFYHALHGVL